MNKQTSKLIISILLVAMAIASIAFGAISVMATQVVQYTIPFYVTNNSTTSYTNLPVIASVNNTAMASGGFMGPQGLDARMLLAGASKPMLLADNKTLTVASSSAAASQVNMSFTTGSSNLTSMPIVLGNGGYITTPDNASLELGSNGYVAMNSPCLSNGTIFNKNGALSATYGSGIVSVSTYNIYQLSYASASSEYGHKDAGTVFPGGSAAFSVDAWANRATTGAQQFIWSNGNTGSTNSTYLIFTAADKIQLFAYNSVGGTAVSWVSTNSTVAGTQYFITATYDNARAPKAIVYVNGNLWGGADGGTGGNLCSPTTFLGIGAGYNGAWVLFMNGTIDEVRVSNIARTATEHTTAYNGGVLGIAFSTDANTTSLWHFSEGSGTTSNDATGNNNLTLVNTPTWVTTSPVPAAVSVMSVAEPASLNSLVVAANTTSSKLELWVNGSRVGNVALGAGITNTAAPYLFGGGFANTSNIRIVVAGTQQLLYQPTAIISGTTMPNSGTLGATGNGVITWGTNPTGVFVTWGAMTSSGAPSSVTTTSTPIESLPQTSGQSNWFGAPNLARLATNPVRPFVLIISDNVNLSEASAWQWLGFAFVLFCTVLTAYGVKGHLMIAGIAAACSMGLLIQQTIWPLWSLVFVVMALIAGLIAERMPWV